MSSQSVKHRQAESGQRDISLEIVSAGKSGNVRISRSSVLFPLLRLPVMIRCRFLTGTGSLSVPREFSCAVCAAVVSAIFRKDLSIELAAALNAGVPPGFIIM